MRSFGLALLCGLALGCVDLARPELPGATCPAEGCPASDDGGTGADAGELDGAEADAGEAPDAPVPEKEDAPAPPDAPPPPPPIDAGLPVDAMPGANGTACSAGTQCQSGLCTEGVCCNAACKGTCQSCRVSGKVGTCTAVPAGQDLTESCADQGASTCGTDGTCDGTGACRRYASGTQCAAPSCAGGSAIGKRTCDGKGTCLPAPAATFCGGWGCEGDVCRTGKCKTNAHCQAPATCVNMECLLPHGLRGEYFQGKNFESSKFVRTDAKVDFDWSFGSPDPRLAADGYTVRWTGKLVPTKTGLHTFAVASDDGVRLWIGGVLLVDAWRDGIAKTIGVQGPSLTAGQAYDVKLEYFEQTAIAAVRLYWTPPGGVEEIVPTAVLVPAP